MTQQEALNIERRIGNAHREIAKARDEQIAARRHVVYALTSDPDHCVFDFEFPPAIGDWWEYEPVALVSGVALSSEPGTVRATGRAGMYNAPQVMSGDCKGATVVSLL